MSVPITEMDEIQHNFPKLSVTKQNVWVERLKIPTKHSIPLFRNTSPKCLGSRKQWLI